MNLVNLDDDLENADEDLEDKLKKIRHWECIKTENKLFMRMILISMIIFK